LILDYLLQSNYPYAWLQVSHDIKNFFTFTNYLISALQNKEPKFGKSTLHLINSINERRQGLKNITEIIPEVIGTFLNEFYLYFKDNIVLVIDDLNNLENSEWLKLTLNQLTENTPTNLHLMLISREIPDFNLSRIASQRNLFEIKSSDLHFNEKEISQLLEEIYNYEYEKDTVKQLENKLDGWITGIHLLLQAYGKDYEKVIKGGKLLPENIFNFFANEIYENLDPDIQTFLLDTALLENFDTKIADFILDSGNSKRIINILLNKNVFIQQSNAVSQEIIQYNYLYLFKNFLNSKLRELKSEEYIKQSYEKIISYYVKSSDTSSVINYSIAANNFEVSLPLIKEKFEKLFEEGKLEPLWKWLSALDELTLSRDPQLLYYKALLSKFFESDFEISLGYVNNAIAIYEKESKSPLLIDCYIFRAGILLNLGRIQEVLEDLIKLIEVKTTPENRAKLLYFLGYSFFINTQYNEALNYLNQSLEICNERNLRIIQFDIYNVLGHIYLNQGDFVKSTHYFEQNYEKTNNVDKRFLTMCNLVDLNAQAGKYEKAKYYLDRAEEFTKLFAVPIFELIVLISATRLRFELGDYEETIRLSEKFNLLSKKFNRKYQIYLSYRFISASYQKMSMYNKAEDYLKLAEIYINETNKFQLNEYSFTKATLEKQQNRLANVEAVFLEAYNYFLENNFLYDRIQVGFHLADFYQKAGNYQSALKYLTEVLDISSEKEYVSYLEKEIFDSRNLFDLALASGIRKEYVRSIASSAIDRVNISWLSEDCKMRLSREIDDLYDIKMNAFGTLEIKIRGSMISDDKWKRKMRKLILAYLLLNPESPLSKEKAIDLFFPDTPSESSENIFHQSISNIRSAVLPDCYSNLNHEKVSAVGSRNSRKNRIDISPKYLVYEERLLRLNPDFLYKTDVTEFNTYYNLFNSSEIHPDERIRYGMKAVALYKGEILSDYYNNWCEDLRAEYSNKFVRMCGQLVTLLSKKKMYEEVIIYSDRLLKADPLNEDAYLAQIEAYMNLDNSIRAKDMFSVMLKAFEAELGEKPSKQILDKISKVLA